MGLFAMLLVLFASALVGEVRGGHLLTPCKASDRECLSRTTSQFLFNTCGGIPEYDIKPIDPLLIPSTDYKASDSSSLVFHFKNLKITGLKNQVFSDFKMDTVKQNVDLTTKADVKVVGEVTMELTQKSKSFSGTFELTGSVDNTATYSYSFKTDNEGVQHYEVGPEKITCRLLGEPKLTIGSELEAQISADPEVSASRHNKERNSKLLKEALCHITSESYITVIHNLRAAAKILPTTSFIKEE